MSDENRPFPVHRQPPADEPTAAARLRVVLLPTAVELGGGVAADETAERPKAARADFPAPSACAHLVIKSAPVTVKATGTVPANDAPAVFATLGTTAVGITGIMAALVTAYLGTEHVPANAAYWFVGLALAELAVAVTVIFRIGRRAPVSHPGPEINLVASPPAAVAQSATISSAEIAD